ncbi:MAG TPA: DUF6790 family protein [Gemmatimonadales bacterium]|nr:DUF6790 family protein [Gemmatimonadales bacterium]
MHLHFTYLLVLLLAGAAVHIAKLSNLTLARGADVLLRYLLVGYCGVPMLAVSLWALLNPAAVARMFDVGAAGPLLGFFGYAYLGMSLVAMLALWYGGTFLVAATVVWAVYLGGATVVHLTRFGQPSAGGVVEIVASHGLIAVLLVTTLAVSGAWRRK